MASNNRTYPSFSFLPQQWNHCSRRNFFLDYGSLGSIYINEDGKTLVQKAHEGSKTCPLSAQFPSLPLFEKPKYGISDIDHVGQNTLKEQKEKFKFLTKRMKELNTIFKRKKCDPDAVIYLLKNVSNYESGDCSAETVFDQFNQTTQLKNLYRKYSNLLDMVSIPITNTAFTGGCLQIIRFPDDPPITAEDCSVCMTAVSGLDLNKIKIFKADLDVSGLLTVDESKTIEVKSPQPLFELSNQCLYDQSLCAARGKNSILMYRISSPYFQFETCKVDEIDFKDETLTSIFMSPYIPAECLIATDKGSVYLWNVDRGHDLVYSRTEPFDPQSSWSDVYYGSHPRSIVLTTHKTMDLFDLRNPAKKTTNLFSLPNRHLKDKERLQVSKYSTSNSFQHFLATDYALFLLDERFPRYPVLQWQHMLKSFPQYMCLVPGVVQSPLDDVLLIGSQCPPEVMGIQYRIPEKEPPISVCSPWCISKTLDFFYMDDMHNKVEDELIKKRLTTPCLGITGQPLNPEGMLVFQLNSMGDIFFQKYNQNTTCRDKTCSAGPGDQVVPLSMEARCRGRYWMEHLREYIQEDYFCGKEHHNLTSIIKSLSNPPNSHVLCRLCMPQCDNEDIESDDEDIMAGSCMTCCSTLRESKWIADGIESDKVIKSIDIAIEKEIPSTENIPKSSNTLTKTLCKLWNDEEIIEEDEEEEVDAGENKEGGKEAEVDKGNAEDKEKHDEEEEENVEPINEKDLLKKSTLNFVDWGGWESEEAEEEESATKILPNAYNVPSTLDRPDSPLMFGPTQSQTTGIISESVPMFLESLQRPESLSSSPPQGSLANLTNWNQQASRISFINKDSQEGNQLPSSFFTNTTSAAPTARSTITSPSIYTPFQRSLNFDNDNGNSTIQKTQDNLLGFFSPVVSQSQIENSQKSIFGFSSPAVSQSQIENFPKFSLGKNIGYEDGFGTITDSQNMEPSCLLSNFSSTDKMSLKKPPLKRNFEEGF